MKRIILLLLIISGSISTSAQSAKWDSTFRPNNYVQRVENFRSYPNSDKDIIFLGNSITDYTDWNELLQINDARNRGISGDITFGILERLDEIIEGKPAKVFILIGINDIARNIPDSVIIDNYRKMIRRIKNESPKTKIYFQTLLPVNNTFPAKNHYGKDDHIAIVNSAIMKFPAEEKIAVLNIHLSFLDDDKKLDKKYTYDGLHLNAEGYKLWAMLLKPLVKD